MIPEWLYGLGGLVLCVLLVPYVLGPILVYFTLRFRMPPTVVAVDLRVHPLPAEARNYLSEAYRELTADGFDLVGTMFLPDLVPNVKTLFAIYANRTTSDMAMSAIIVAQGGLNGELKTSYVKFVRPLRRRGRDQDKQLGRIGVLQTHDVRVHDQVLASPGHPPAVWFAPAVQRPVPPARTTDLPAGRRVPRRCGAVHRESRAGRDVW